MPARGEARNAGGDPAGALLDIDRARELDPADPHLAAQAARLLATAADDRVRNGRQALALATRAVDQLGPRDAAALEALAAAQAAVGDRAAAMATIEAALWLPPGDRLECRGLAYGHRELALVLTVAADPAEAQARREAALAAYRAVGPGVDPRHAPPRTARGTPR